MSIFDESKDVVGKHIGKVTEEALSTIVTKLAGAVKTVSSPQPSAVSGKMARAYNAGVMDANNKVPMRIPAFCYDKIREGEIVTEVENHELIAEYMRGYNDKKSKIFINRILIYGGIGIGGITLTALVLEYKKKK